MQLEELDLTVGGKNMKCSFCGKECKPSDNDLPVCDDCIGSADELSNGKGDENE